MLFIAKAFKFEFIASFLVRPKGQASETIKILQPTGLNKTQSNYTPVCAFFIVVIVLCQVNSRLLQPQYLRDHVWAVQLVVNDRCYVDWTISIWCSSDITALSITAEILLWLKKSIICVSVIFPSILRGVNYETLETTTNGLVVWGQGLIELILQDLVLFLLIWPQNCCQPLSYEFHGMYHDFHAPNCLSYNNSRVYLIAYFSFLFSYSGLGFLVIFLFLPWCESNQVGGIKASKRIILRGLFKTSK